MHIKTKPASKASYRCMAAGWHKVAPLRRKLKGVHYCDLTLEVHQSDENSGPILRIMAVREHNNARQKMYVSIVDQESLKALAKAATEARKASDKSSTGNYVDSN